METLKNWSDALALRYGLKFSLSEVTLGYFFLMGEKLGATNVLALGSFVDDFKVDGQWVELDPNERANPLAVKLLNACCIIIAGLKYPSQEHTVDYHVTFYERLDKWRVE